MSVELDEVTEITTETDTPQYAHIVDRGDRQESASAMVLTAMITGTTVTALCGHTWVPSKVPQAYPICPKCEEMFEFARDFRGV